MAYLGGKYLDHKYHGQYSTLCWCSVNIRLHKYSK